MALRDRVRKAEGETGLRRIRCTVCGERWLTAIDLEMGSILEGWAQAMGKDPDPRLADVHRVAAHEHEALVYEANPDPEMVGQPVFSEFPKGT
jgi:hypothetical protein